jgi:hypothetical protein
MDFFEIIVRRKLEKNLPSDLKKYVNMTKVMNINMTFFSYEKIKYQLYFS